MPGMLGTFGSRDPSRYPVDPPPILHRPGSTKLEEWRSAGGFVQHARLEFVELQDTTWDAEGYRCWYCGDLPAHDRVPWSLFIDAIRDDDWRRVGDLHLPFAAVVFAEEQGRAWLVSDRRSQYPLFYRLRRNALEFSTLAAAFATSLGGARFAPEWLYEVLYFNYPVLETSFLEGVRRMPPATVLSWDIGGEDVRVSNYAQPFSRPDSFVSGQEGLDLARDTFSAAAADCFRTRHPVAVALTAGFDARSALSFAPPRDAIDLETYTYGQPGCYDLEAAAGVARELGLPHRPIEFDDPFLANLPQLLGETVRQSDGQERILRATLPTVFSTLAEAGRRVVVSGVSGDHIFRDHVRGRGNVPVLMSEHLMDRIETGADHVDDPVYKEILGSGHADFREHILSALAALEERHGPLSGPEGYVRFLVYENAPKYFGGEAAIAGQHLVYRTPYWDSRVIDLAFRLERGTVGLSTRMPMKDRYIEAGLQAHLIQNSPNYGGATVKGISAAAFARGNRFLYGVERVLRLGPRKLSKLGRTKPVPPLENWRGWLDGVLAPRLADLLGDDARLNAHIPVDALRGCRQSGDPTWIGKLATAEIVLRLLENDWRLAD